MGILDFMFKDNNNGKNDRVIVVQENESGASGTEIYSGIYDEDYLTELQGTEKATLFDKMRRGDARVKMCLSAVKNPLRSADWIWQPAENDKTSEEHAEFLTHVFNDLGAANVYRRKKFKRLLSEFLTCCDFGYVCFERSHKRVMGHQKWGDYIGLKNLGWRSPKTLEYFHLDPNGELLSVEQESYGDVERKVKMDAKFLNIVTLEQEGDNYEGISLLRPCIGAWKRKQMYLKLLAIGIEKTAIPTPDVEVPAGKENSDEYNNMKATLKKLTTHQQNYIMRPQGWTLGYLDTKFDPQKVKDTIMFENQEMVFAFLANFLELGAQSSGGSYALSSDLSDFFTNGILYIADLIAEEITTIGKELIDLNFGPQETYPQMVHRGIVDQIGKEFSEIMKALTESGHITPDDTVENELRRRLKLAPMREEDARDLKKETEPKPPKTGKDGKPEPDETEEDLDEQEEEEDPEAQLSEVMRFAEQRAKQQIKNGRGKIGQVLKNNLSDISKNLTADIMKNYKSLPDAKKIESIYDVQSKGRAKYLKELKEVMVELTFSALKQASLELPKKVRKFMDDDNLVFAEFEDLPPVIRKYLLMQSRMLVQTTTSDLEKVTYMQFGDSVLSTDSASILEMDLKQAGETYVNGASVAAASGNTASRLINESRSAAFFDDDVLEEVDSFTFTNPDPTAPICRDLAGRTFSKDDAEAKRYFPPLHHNCESYIVPNLVGGKNNPKIDKRGLKTKFVATF
jgi:hypothetical protein